MSTAHRADTAPRMAVVEAEFAPLPADAEAPAFVIGRLYEQHYRMVRGLCQLLLRNPVDAEDAAQQTFLSGFSALIGGTVPRQPAPWLAMIARRECWARTAKRRAHSVALDESDAPTAGRDPLEQAIAHEDVAAIWQAINDLPRQQRDAFLMREFSGLSYGEAAVALGVTESAIESLLVRARRQLRDGLEASLGAANLAATPLLLLQKRFGRIFGKPAGAAAGMAGTPVAAKLGVMAAATVIVGAAGVGVGGKLGLHHRAQPSSASAAALPGAADTAHARYGLVNGAAARAAAARVGRQTFPARRGGRPAPNEGGGADRGLGIQITSPPPAGASDPSAQGDPARPPEAAPSAPATDGTPDSGGASPADSTPTDTATPDTIGPGALPAETTPTDTDPTVTTPTDTTPTDTTPTDTSPTDTTPSDTVATSPA